MTKLQKLERDENLREVWPTEDGHFTPWLAKDENIGILSDTLGIELNDPSTEESVGDLRADIVCTDANDNRVLIENQLEPTDHKHVGQVLTYAAGLEAVTIIWIAERIKEDHRAAVDWLNQVTIDTVRFFALEIELWRISECGPAPKFNVVSKPNNWARTVRNQSGDGDSLNDAQRVHSKFWTRFVERLNQSGFALNLPAPSHRQQMRFSIGKGLTDLRATRLNRDQALRVALYMRGPTNSLLFDALSEQQDLIEEEIESLEWEQTDDTSSIYVTDNRDLSNESDWDAQIDWFAGTLTKFDEVFTPLV